MASLRENARRHLSDIVVQYVLNGGDIGKLLLDAPFESSYETLRQALQAVGWPEAAGRVQSHLERKCGAKLAKTGRKG